MAQSTTSNPYSISPKQPSEVLDYDFDFSQRLPTGDTISSVLSVTLDQNTITLGSGATGVTNTGTVVKVWLLGGLSGTRYKVTCRVLTVGGRTMESDMFVLVQDV